MKKIILAVLLLMSIINIASASVSVVTIVKIVSAAVSLYKVTPEAEYTITIVDANGRGMTYCVSSATAAIKAAIVALENGAQYVNLDSVYPTVNPSCHNKTYYKRDIEYLKNR